MTLVFKASEKKVRSILFPKRSTLSETNRLRLQMKFFFCREAYKVKICRCTVTPDFGCQEKEESNLGMRARLCMGATAKHRKYEICKADGLDAIANLERGDEMQKRSFH